MSSQPLPHPSGPSGGWQGQEGESWPEGILSAALPLSARFPGGSRGEQVPGPLRPASSPRPVPLSTLPATSTPKPAPGRLRKAGSALQSGLHLRKSARELRPPGEQDTPAHPCREGSARNDPTFWKRNRRPRAQSHTAAQRLKQTPGPKTCPIDLGGPFQLRLHDAFLL